MVSRIMSAILTSDLRFDDYGFEVRPFGVFKQGHQVACRPEFDVIVINLPNTLKKGHGRIRGLVGWCCHGTTSIAHSKAFAPL